MEQPPTIRDSSVRAVFQPSPDAPIRALLVAGCCGNVGFGKLGQLARMLVKHGVPVLALDPSPAVQNVKDRLAEALKSRFSADEIAAVLDAITVVQGSVADLPAGVPVGFVFEAIPERLDLKRSFYEALRARDPEAFIFSATSGLTTRKLFGELAGRERCGVLHPFFPHLTNKLWELPVADAVTGEAELAIIRKLFGRLGMNLIPVRDVASFAADRLFCGMMLEAVRLHVDLGLSPAQVDDVCRRSMGTSPFYVHNMIRGANGLSAHCIALMAEEVDSTLFAIPDAWRPYLDDPDRKWPYGRGESCPPDLYEEARDRMHAFLFALTAYMIEHDICTLDALTFLAEKALAFREAPPAMIEAMRFGRAQELVRRYLETQAITNAEEVAPLAVFDEANATAAVGWFRLYVDYKVQGDIGLISLKRTTINHTFIAELDRALEILQRDKAVQAIVLAPDGLYSREFGHGADLQCFVPVLGHREAALALIRKWKRTLSKLRAGKPTVAAMAGRVLGGGLELASSCHARVAAARTRLGQPETTVGVLPGLGGCHLIHRAARSDAAARINELLLTGHSFPAEEGATWGFVHSVVDISELPRASFALASALAAEGVPAFREGGAEVTVDRRANPCNEQGVPLDADLRELLARTIEECNALPLAEASALEEQRAAESLCMSTSRIGVAAMTRGKPPQFENPLPTAATPAS